MLLPVEEIEVRLANLGVPSHLVAQHVGRVTKWRKSHPKKIKRKRLYVYDDQPISASGHTLKPRTERWR